jgi:hypothetical protein
MTPPDHPTDGDDRGVDTPARTVLVACERPRDAGRAAQAGVLMRRLATALERLPPLRVRTIWLDPGETEPFRAEIARSRPRLALLLGTPDSSLTIERLAGVPRADGPVLLNARDATAVRLTAATLLAVNQRRRRTGVARVLIVDSDRLPGLDALLSAADVGELTLWSSSDASTFPLRRVIAGVDAVINLSAPGVEPLLSELYRTPAPLFATEHQRTLTLLEPDWSADPVLVLPGLAYALSASCGVRADLAGLDLTYYDMCFACALELVMATASGDRQLPRPSRELDRRLAAAAGHAVLAPAAHPLNENRDRQ